MFRRVTREKQTRKGLDGSITQSMMAWQNRRSLQENSEAMLALSKTKGEETLYFLQYSCFSLYNLSYSILLRFLENRLGTGICLFHIIRLQSNRWFYFEISLLQAISLSLSLSLPLSLSLYLPIYLSISLSISTYLSLSLFLSLPHSLSLTLSLCLSLPRTLYRLLSFSISLFFRESTWTCRYFSKENCWASAEYCEVRRLTDRQRSRQIIRQTNRQMKNRQTDRQTDR